MKKIIYSSLLLVGATLCMKAQNTIPTTTVTGALSVNDSLHVTKNITTAGDITSKGEVVATDTMRAQKDILIDGNAKVGGDLSIAGKSTFEQEMVVKKSLLFAGGNEFSYTPATATSRAVFYLGNTSAKPLPWITCANPNVNALPQFINPGSFISRVPTGSGLGQTNSSLSFYSAPWGGSGIIEVEGTDQFGGSSNGLLINYFCGRNTGINVGWDIPNGKDGGTVFMGAKVDMQNSLKIGWTQSGVIDLNTSIEINQNGNNANGVKVQTWNTGVKAYSIMRNDGKNTFVVYGDGKTQIGVEKVGSGPHTDAMLSVSGKVACKEVRVFNNTSGYWADFVFDKNYKLMPLSEVECYYKNNKHLPNIPTAKQIEEDGNDLAKTDALLLQKIEELTLYIVQQQKEIEALKKEIKK
ncbi:MAG TPA: hypothetical protein PKZ75_15430 [Bacteroidia bacterium]|nr:hypothetical protein [Bacteroidia bacterium]